MTEELPEVARDRNARSKRFGGAHWWSAYGMQGRFGARLATRNEATKPGYAHKPHATKRQARDSTYGQLDKSGQLSLLGTGQKCVPPHIRLREKLEQPRPLNVEERRQRYLGTVRPGLTPAQLRRMRKKLNHSMAKARGSRPETPRQPPAKTPEGTQQPHSGELSRGFRRMIGRLSPDSRARALARRS